MKAITFALAALSLGLTVSACSHKTTRTTDAQPVVVIPPPAQSDIPADPSFDGPKPVAAAAPAVVPVAPVSEPTTSATTHSASDLSLGASSSGRGH